MGGSGSTLAAAVEYSNVIFAGALAYWALSAVTSIVRGAGQAAILAVVYLVGEAVHVVLVPVLVFGVGPLPPLGISGAGLATVISFTLSAIVLAWYVASGRTAITLSLRSVRLDRRLFAEILRVGAPMSLQPVLNNVALALLTGFAAALGPTALAGFGAAVRLEYLQIPLTFGLGAGLLAMVGTSIGAGRLTRAARITWLGAVLTVGATASIGFVALIRPGLWVTLFSTDAAVLTLAASYLAIVSLTYPFLGLGFALSYAFQAAGRPWWPLLATLSRVLVIAGGGWIAIHSVGSGLPGLAVVAASGLIVYGSILAVAFRAGAWLPGASR
jgi:putative MATE family efflux protein